ncbi:histone-lysine N-methyltransferase SETMAR [Caerostris darwini]|uniref:Histone-lysine N-methyltransferase SETMAR n=1 Tax=Caerostris darwini TaxID=1538125 RepID=A0AAV4WJQ6_9ARAC|nr:histone-lysine N-methyltransferase SETMAR [Caerostris darwini]
MARRSENWSRLEVPAVIRFLWAKNVSASDIHSQIVDVYGEEAMSRQHVAEWCRSFQSGRQDVENRTMAGRDRSSSSMTEINTARVEEMIQIDLRATLREISSELRLSFGSVQHIVSDVLRYSKVCARWVPRALSHLSSALPF